MSTNVNSSHIDAALTNFALQLPIMAGQIQDLVCPIINVKKETDVYWTFNREELKTHRLHRANGAETHELDISKSTASYACEEYGIKAFVTRREMDNADKPIKPKLDLTRTIVNATRIGRERRCATLIQTAGNWSGSATPTTKWDAAGVDILAQLRAAIKAFRLQSGTRPNTAVVNSLVADAIVDWMKDQPGGISLADFRMMVGMRSEVAGPDPVLAGFAGIGTWLVGQQMQDTAGIGEAESLGEVWGSHCTLLYLEKNPSIRSASAAYTFQNRGFQTEGWREPARDGEYVQTTHILVEKVVSAALGYHLYNCLT